MKVSYLFLDQLDNWWEICPSLRYSAKLKSYAEKRFVSDNFVRVFLRKNWNHFARANVISWREASPKSTVLQDGRRSCELEDRLLVSEGERVHSLDRTILQTRKDSLCKLAVDTCTHWVPIFLLVLLLLSFLVFLLSRLLLSLLIYLISLYRLVLLFLFPILVSSFLFFFLPLLLLSLYKWKLYKINTIY